MSKLKKFGKRSTTLQPSQHMLLSSLCYFCQYKLILENIHLSASFLVHLSREHIPNSRRVVLWKPITILQNIKGGAGEVVHCSRALVGLEEDLGPVPNTEMVTSMVAHAFNPCTWEAEAGRFLSSRQAWSIEWVPETLSPKKKKKEIKMGCVSKGAASSPNCAILWVETKVYGDQSAKVISPWGRGSREKQNGRKHAASQTDRLSPVWT